jgi:hypothetical protein
MGDDKDDGFAENGRRPRRVCRPGPEEEYLKQPVSPAPVAPEQPILWLGVSGFSPEQKAALQMALARTDELPQWRVGAFAEADAWWVNGEKVRVAPDGTLRVAPGLPTEHALRLDLADVDRPIAFGVPLGCDEFEPQVVFDPASPPSTQAVLLQFDSWLWLVRAQFVLGRQIIEQGADLRHGVYHVSSQGRLLAVLDFAQGNGAILPRAHPVDLAEARWDRRPPGARDLPETFVRVTPAQLAWTYVSRTDRDLLPRRYRDATIYFRHAPGVPIRWLRDSQLNLLRELAADPGTLESLYRRTGLPMRQLERDLTALYYGYAITTTRSKAAQRSPSRYDSVPHSVGPGLDSLLNADQVSHPADPTVPAQLEHRFLHGSRDDR